MNNLNINQINIGGQFIKSTVNRWRLCSIEG